MSLKPDAKTADSLVDLLLEQRSGDLNALVSALLFGAAEEYARASGEHEFAFMDRGMRLYAGSLLMIDAPAARAYLQALATRADPNEEPRYRASAETMRAQCYVDLFKAFRLAARRPRGTA